MKRYQTVDEYVEAQEKWRPQIEALRELINSTRLSETVKWGAPTYTIDGKNVVGLGAFKNFVAIWFYQGALMGDPLNKLINAQEGKTQALRQWRFSVGDDIVSEEVLSYLEEAITNQEMGKQIVPPKTKPLEIPAELKQAFSSNPKVEACFDDMGLTKKREFAEYIGEAKREETKLKRLDKIIPMILEGKGLHDKYRK